MNIILLIPILLPTLAGLLCLFIPRRVKFIHEFLALAGTIISLGVSAVIFMQEDLRFTVPWFSLGTDFVVQFDLLAGEFGSFILLGACTFAALIAIYSLKYMEGRPRLPEYYGYLLLTLAMSAGAALANHLLVFLFFWDLLALFLYALITHGGKDAIPGANKTLLMIGGADLAMLLGIILLWQAGGSLTMSELAQAPLVLTSWPTIAAYFLILAGAMAKAGAIPLHSWIPAIASTTPMPVMAYLPASLDKLLGIYLLANISLFWFVLSPAVGLVLMIIGAITIMAAVLMALIQHDYRKMLSFHAVSQVGYMVLGIGTGTPVGVIGGLFHMLNHAIYKSCLFLCAGAVKRQTGRTKFEELGGLASAMPWTFIISLVAALAISGVPPMNGFVSKWLIYQGLLDRGGNLFPLFILAAMFGSALTLASFMKLTYSIFWGDRPKDLPDVAEAPASMRLPMIVLAGLCVVFGVFYSWPLTTFITPILGESGINIAIPGIWQSGLATLLIILSLAAGLIFYLGGRSKNAVETDVFLGGEAIDPEVYRVAGTQFYGPIKQFGGLKQLYERAERGVFDLYVRGSQAIAWTARVVTKYIDQALNDLYREVIPSVLAVAGQFVQMLNARNILTLVMWIVFAAGFALLLIVPGNAVLLNLTRIFALVGIFAWGLLALVEGNLRRLLFFAVTSQAGFVLLGATFSWQTALFHLLSSTVAFLALFLCCGSIGNKLNTNSIEEMDGLSKRMPGQAIVFLLAGLWLSGLPPFGNFFSKYMLGLEAGEASMTYSILIAAAAILTLGYFLRPLRIFLHGEG